MTIKKQYSRDTIIDEKRLKEVFLQALFTNHPDCGTLYVEHFIRNSKNEFGCLR